MMHWILAYDLVDDYLDRRPPLRPSHLALVRAAHERGELLLAGAVGDPVDSALLVWNVDDPAVIAAFARSDPYVVAGLVTSWRVKPWHVVSAADLA